MSRSVTTGLAHLETTIGSIRYWDKGRDDARPRLLFLQGLLTGPNAWDGVVATLGERHRCITVDWPFGAHSEPMRSGANLSPPRLARLVMEVLDALALSTAVLIGNDSGGVVAQLVLAESSSYGQGRTASSQRHSASGWRTHSHRAC